jgi:putative ABC transport system ATP-binding protein
VEDGIVLEAVTKAYGTGGARVMVLGGVSLSVPGGQFVSIIGPSGSGKSTLLNLIAGLDVPTSGRVLVAGHDLGALSDDGRSDLRLRRIGIVFQSFNLLPSFTVEENVRCPLEFAGERDRTAVARARAALTEVKLPESAFGRRPAELSGGEQQRAAIARALVTQPELLLADEPTGNLDSATGQVVLDLLRRLNLEKRLTVILVTHSTLAARYGDRTVELRDGRIVRDVSALEPSGRANRQL